MAHVGLSAMATTLSLLLHSSRPRSRAEGISFSLSVRVADVASRPKKNSLLTYNGTEYRVAETTLDSAGLTWTIYLKSKNSL